MSSAAKKARRSALIFSSFIRKRRCLFVRISRSGLMNTALTPKTARTEREDSAHQRSPASFPARFMSVASLPWSWFQGAVVRRAGGRPDLVKSIFILAGTINSTVERKL